MKLGTWIVVLAVACGIIIYACTRPRCLKGHYETVTVHESSDLMPIANGNGGIILIPMYTPEHQAQRWVCEQYEK